jgi:hypothetical protein
MQLTLNYNFQLINNQKGYALIGVCVNPISIRQFINIILKKMKTFLLTFFLFLGFNTTFAQIIYFEKDDKVGYKNEITGKIVHKPIYNFILEISGYEGRLEMVVDTEYFCNFINLQTGKFLLPKWYKYGIDELYLTFPPDKNGRILASLYSEDTGESKQFIYDTTGTLLFPSNEFIECKYSFGNMVALKNKAGKWGIRNFDGSQVVDFIYDDIEAFKWSYSLDTKWDEIVNEKGHIICAKNIKGKMKWGVRDTKGNEIVPYEYDVINEYETYYEVGLNNNDEWVYSEIYLND